MTLRLRTRTRIAAVLCVVLGTCAVARAQSGTTPPPVAELPYTIAPLGGISIATMGTGPLGAGYARIVATSGNTTPAGLVIFGFRQNGILVSEAGVPASALILTGRIYAEVSGAVNTGLALANPNGQPATINFFFTDAAGGSFGAGSTTVAANGQIAGFLNQAPFNGASNINGTFTFTSNVPVGVIAFRGLSNERGEFLITTLPVADLSQAAGTQTVLFPHFADGGGWTTQVVLVNSSDQESLSGTVQFVGQGTASAPAEPVPVTIGGVTASSFNYTIPARSSRVLRTSNPAGATLAGSVRITPQTGARAPSGLGIFSFKLAGVTVTEAGVVAAAPATAQRMYAESSGAASGSIQTGVAVANSKIDAVNVDFSLTRLDGSATGLSARLTVPGNGGQVAVFLNQIPGFQTLPVPFQGVLRIASTTTTGVAVVGLRGRTNERGEFLITTTPPVDENAPASAAELFFPHFADGGGYTTQFILSSGSTQASIGTLKFFGQSGGALALSLAPPGPAGPLSTYTLSTSTAGTGSGVISPAGGTYASGTVVTLTATPNVGSTFIVWSGACSGTGACVVTMSAAKSVTARFDLNTPTVTQTIIAALGGTITLPGGTRVVIPPALLKNDQQVSVSLLATMPRPVPSGLLSSVGPAVSITFPRGVGNPVVPSGAGIAKVTADSSTRGIQVAIVTNSLPTDPNSYVLISEVIPPQATVQSNGGMFSALPSSDAGTALFPDSMLNYLSQGAVDSPFTVNVGNVTWNSNLPRYAVRYGPRIWEPKAREWLSLDSPTISLKRGVKTCVLVHGMLSTVEKAFAEGSDCENRVNEIGSANGCDQVVGFNYDWTKRIKDSGANLAAFLDSLKNDYGISDIVLEAHSEGGPVAIAGGGQTSSGIRINNLVTLGSPLTGTPAADRGEQVLSWLAYNAIGQTFPVAGGALGVPEGLLLKQAVGAVLPFLQDLTTQSGLSGNLYDARQLFNQKHPEAAVTAIAGTGGTLLPYFGSTSTASSILNGWLFGNQQQDSIVNGASALGQNSGLNIKTALTFALSHTGLECDPRVISAVGQSLKAATITLSASTLNFSMPVGGANPTSQSLTVTNSAQAGNSLIFTIAVGADWLQVSPTSGSLSSGSSTNLTVSINGVGLLAGTHQAVVSVSDPKASNSPQKVSVTLTVTPVPPTSPAATIAVSPNALVFSASESGFNPGSQNFTIRNAGPAGTTLNYQVSASVGWIGLSGPIRQLSSGDSEFFTASINISGLTTGTHAGTITVADPNSTNKAQTISVTLTITSAATFVLTVAKTGTGTGTVTATANPPNPGPTYPAGTVVTLTATPSSGSTFTGWSGACSGTGSCVVTMNSAKSVTATFAISASPTVLSFVANPTTITVGQTSVLSWSTTNATSVSISGVPGPQPASGSVSVSPAVTTTYTLTATGPGGATSATTTLTVVPGGGGAVTGSWAGTWTRPVAGFCEFETSALTWNLTQSGNSVSGSFTRRVTAIDPFGLCPDPVGFTESGTLVNGTLSGSSLTIFTAGGTRFDGTVSGTTISGTGGTSLGRGAFSLTKQ